MGLVDRVVRGAEFRQQPTSTLANPAAWLFDALGAEPSHSGERVSIEGAMGIPAVFAVVSRISGMMRSLPLKVYRTMEGGPRVEAREHRAWRFLHDKPNDITPSDLFWATTMNHLLLWGNAFLEKRRGSDGLVESLWLVPPAGMHVQWDGRRKWFWKLEGADKKEWTDEEILHIVGFSTDGLVGVSPISMCRHAFGAALARDKFEGGFYKRGARLPGVIQAKDRLSDIAFERLAEAFKGQHTGTKNMHKVPVLEEGAEFKSVSMPLRDMEFVQSQQLTLTQVAIMFGVPPANVAGLQGSSLTYSTRESNKLEEIQTALLPRTRAIERALVADPNIFPQSVFYAEFVIEGLLRGEAQNRANYYKTLVEVNAITANEIRERENMPPLSGGDVSPTVAGQAVSENGQEELSAALT